MRGKAGLVIGLAVGYVLGTRAGRERYDQIKEQWLKVWNLDPVQEQVGKVKDFAKSTAMALPSTLWDSAVKVGKAASAKGTPGQRLDAAKAWLKRTAKDAGIGSGWIVGALFVLFWSIPVFGTFVIAGLSSWWPVWVSALVVFVVMLLVTAVLGLLGYLRFRKLSKAQNPVQTIAQDVKEIRDEL